MITPRPLKFRAWTGSEMVAVESLSRNAGCLIWYGPTPHMGIADCWDSEMWSVDNPKPKVEDLKPVMQFTGVIDDNGVEVYEGDILIVKEVDFYHERDSGSDREGEIWENVVVRHDGLGFKLRLNEYRADEDFGFAERFEVVGNVFANPSLVKS